MTLWVTPKVTDCENNLATEKVNHGCDDFSVKKNREK